MSTTPSTEKTDRRESVEGPTNPIHDHATPASFVRAPGLAPGRWSARLRAALALVLVACVAAGGVWLAGFVRRETRIIVVRSENERAIFVELSRGWREEVSWRAVFAKVPVDVDFESSTLELAGGETRVINGDSYVVFLDESLSISSVHFDVGERFAENLFALAPEEPGLPARTTFDTIQGLFSLAHPRCGEFWRARGR